jgi:RNA polymerase sigma-70 factor (ECF subfamily)
MDENEILSERFKANRERLRAVAYRMLGSLSDAEDAVQEAWIRLNGADAAAVDNLAGWLTTVVARICLDMLRARNSRRETALDSDAREAQLAHDAAIDPEQEALLADSVGVALMVVLQKLDPAERIAFVLHDMFDLPFDEIAPIVQRSPDAARQLASRARRRVRESTAPDSDAARERAIVDAFLAAAREGNLQGLLAVLDPDVVVHADAAAMRLGARAETRGAATIAAYFSGRAQAARPALIDGSLGIVVAPRGRLFVVLRLTFKDGKITAIDSIADRERMDRFDVTMLDDDA